MVVSSKAQKELKSFMAKESQISERNFVCLFTGNSKLSLKFEMGKGAYTDGQNIVVDPAVHNTFADKKLLEKIMAYLKWPVKQRKKVLGSEWLALKFLTRAQSLHEALHILYSDFPPPAKNDPRLDTKIKQQVMARIGNIIEDAYIENVGCSEYDNIHLYIDFGRVAEGFATLKDPDYFVVNPDTSLIEQYLNEMIRRNLYPFIPKVNYDKAIDTYVEKTEQLYKLGSVASSSEERYEYCRKIYELILPLLNKAEKEQKELNKEMLSPLFNDHRTHEDEGNKAKNSKGQAVATQARGPYPQPENPKDKEQGNGQTGEKQQEGQEAVPGNGASDEKKDEQIEKENSAGGSDNASDKDTDKDAYEKKSNDEATGAPDNESESSEDETGEKVGGKQQSKKMTVEAEKEQRLADQLEVVIKGLQREEEAIVEKMPQNNGKIHYDGEDLSGTSTHKGIRVDVNHASYTDRNKEAYLTAYERYRLTIAKYNRAFKRILKAYVEEREEKRLFGSGINSSRLYDRNKRFWFKKLPQVSVPDLAVLLLIDGSGSMAGARTRAAQQAAIILHEVLQTQGLMHAITEHRTIQAKSIEINVLFDFGAKDLNKYSIVKSYAGGCNRDGLALAWVGKYIEDKVQAENKLVIVISDGMPNHGSYYGANAIKDTANAAKRLTKKGIEVVAIALEEKGETYTYDGLKQIYKNVILCDDLHQLTKQVLETVSNLLMVK